MSSITKAHPSSNNDNMSTEESGWTSYFDDFFNNYVHNNKCSMSLSGVATSFSSSSLLSDAASLVEKKEANNSKQVEEFYGNKNVIKRSSFKEKKDVITALIDDSMEDTATSPLNSSMVLYANDQKIDKAKRQK